MSFIVPAANIFSIITTTNNQLFWANLGLPKYTRMVGFQCSGSQIEAKHLMKSNKRKIVEM